MKVIGKGVEFGMTVEEVLQRMQPFSPVAYYDKHLDAIRVQILDCSVLEKRLDGLMTVYHVNRHPNPDGVNDIAGFCIKGVRQLFAELGMPAKDGPVQLAALLDKIFGLFPTWSTKMVVEYYRHLKRPPEVVNIEFAPATA